jgi:uncharacterized membrane protein YciS (DUF1049 family)
MTIAALNTVIAFVFIVVGGVAWVFLFRRFIRIRSEIEMKNERLRETDQQLAQAILETQRTNSEKHE